MLPQTLSQPSTETAAFRCEMRALWSGVRTGRLKPALAAFFPEAAYAQLKAIADPQADWTTRLLDGYALDLGAAHALLNATAGAGAGAGRGALQAKLIGVDVPAGFAHLVEPGACYNRLAYWEIPNSRLVYRENGVVRSIGIASMISWRGLWFVIHLGAVVPTGPGGTVDAPSVGVGVPVASGTC